MRVYNIFFYFDDKNERIMIYYNFNSRRKEVGYFCIGITLK
jgi:hypothetical protein